MKDMHNNACQGLSQVPKDQWRGLCFYLQKMALQIETALRLASFFLQLLLRDMDAHTRHTAA